jgi:serine/threonine kinase PknH
MRALQPGDPSEIGGYQLRAHLGGGGMGKVYLASTPGGRLVALKSIRPELMADNEFQERFRLEVRAARQVRGLYTAELLDADPDAIPPWLVTSYVPGPSLAQAVKAQGPAAPELVPLLMAGVAEALVDIHAAGIVHRDLKPSNVLLSPDGPRVIDFGIARALDDSKLTLTGVTMGSPECMTPEQVRGLPVTPAADVFSLGSLGFYAASGRPPFEAPNSAAMMYRVVHEEPVLDAFPAGIRQLLERCFSKDPDGRPSPAEVLETCRALIPELPAVFPQSWRSEAGTAPPEPELKSQPASTPEPAPKPELTPELEPAPQPQPAPKPQATPKHRPTPKPRPAPRKAPRPSAGAWLMCGAAALAIAALAVGLVTLPSLRTTLSQQHVPAAVRLAAVVIVSRALTSAGMWLWAARAATRGHRRARTVAYVALAVSTLDLASSLLGLSTAIGLGLTLAGVGAGLAAVGVGGLRLSAPGRRRLTPP